MRYFEKNRKNVQSATGAVIVVARQTSHVHVHISGEYECVLNRFDGGWLIFVHCQKMFIASLVPSSLLPFCVLLYSLRSIVATAQVAIFLNCTQLLQLNYTSTIKLLFLLVVECFSGWFFSLSCSFHFLVLSSLRFWLNFAVSFFYVDILIDAVRCA